MEEVFIDELKLKLEKIKEEQLNNEIELSNTST